MNDIIRNVLSVISILISIIALVYSMKSSYNPKLKIEPLFNKETSSVGDFFDFWYKRLERFNPGILIEILCIPIILLYIPKLIIKGKNRVAYGIKYGHSNDIASVVLWLRIINPSKYPITIYNVVNQNKIFAYTEMAFQDMEFDNWNLQMKDYISNENININKPYEDFLSLPIKIEPFSYIEKYIVMCLPNRLFKTRRKYFQPKFNKINITFYTSTKKFTKKIKVYNGNKSNKNTDIQVAFKKFINSQ